MSNIAAEYSAYNKWSQNYFELSIERMLASVFFSKGSILGHMWDFHPQALSQNPWQHCTPSFNPIEMSKAQSDGQSTSIGSQEQICHQYRKSS